MNKCFEKAECIEKIRKKVPEVIGETFESKIVSFASSSTRIAFEKLRVNNNNNPQITTKYPLLSIVVFSSISHITTPTLPSKKKKFS